MPFAPAAEVQYVQFGSTVTLGCNTSYLYHTTWVKHNQDLTPTIVLCASLREGQPVQEFQLSPRFSVGLVNRSLALIINGVEPRDLGLYYCIAIVNTQLTVGRGTVLQVSSSSSVQFLFHNWYYMVVGFGLLIMALSVLITHWKTKSQTQRNTEISVAGHR
ncbi:hypothetical protein Q8A73_003878 [Channa argus]|nr:hypothetical protein Q8A73_003878 [Channa argus]